MPWGSTRTNSHVMRERDEMERDKCLGAPLALIVDVMRERETNKQSSRETVRWGSALCISQVVRGWVVERQREEERDRVCVRERARETRREGVCVCMCVCACVCVRVCHFVCV